MDKAKFNTYQKKMSQFWQTKYEKFKGEERHVVGRMSAPLKEYETDTQHIKDCFSCVIEKAETVIDFGCGIGRFEDLLNKFFDNYIGVDIVRKIPKTRIFYTVEDFWKVSLRADAIFTSVVIQHITDDKYVAKLVKRFSEILPIGGCVYMNEQVGDGEIVYRGDFPYINRRTRKTYLKLFKPQGFELEREIPRRHHRILKFRKVK